MRQETGQSISDYYSQTSSIWEQLSAADPPLQYLEDIELFAKYRGHRKFMHFMMGLHEDFEPTRVFLLSQSPTPSLDNAVKELTSKENRRPIYHMSSSDHVLATPSLPPQPSIVAITALPRLTSGRASSRFLKGTHYEFCRAIGHDISVYHKLHPIFTYTANGTPMLVNHKGTISTPSLSLSDTFHIPKLSLNLLSVGQLCELGVDILFTNHDVDVQDPRMDQVLGTSRKVGHMFEVHDLKIPSQVVSAASITTTLSLDLWHANLGHTSLSHLPVILVKN
ncbi:uncharacterized protein LOC142609064 [Castanea sativa]|uniref:uncharacterized protein LOC142609064 n=1 Tax=Castanea sativa TaxID=21020 RepID=UPI003F652D87